ncbi:MAG: hypothetical protein KC615_19745 [Anaerolineae bacterium]|nr:hypothetical protein [Anaerolineae bacterium]
MLTAILIILTVFCALLAVVSTRLLHATLWLAAVSALVGILLYQLGAWEIAVIELSVGAGLVTVLMVFAITMIGDPLPTPHVSRRTLLIFVILAMSLIVGMTVNSLPAPVDVIAEPLGTVLWQVRGLDMAAQIVLIFAGVLGVLGLLSVSDDIVRVQVNRTEHHASTTPLSSTAHITQPSDAPELSDSMRSAPSGRLEKEPV